MCGAVATVASGPAWASAVATSPRVITPTALPCIHHRQLLEATAQQQRGGILERLLGRHGLDAAEHRRADRDAVDRVLELRHRALLIGARPHDERDQDE